MRDTRDSRKALVIAVTAAAGAVIGQMFVQPYIEKMFK